jgi:hypothetical protein
VISRFAHRDYVRISVYKKLRLPENVIRMIRMSHVMKIGLGVALSFMTLAQAAQADEFKLSNNQRISCSRGLSAGKLNTATCKSYAYLFNVKTSEYFRCQVTLALTRDNKEVINVAAAPRSRASSRPTAIIRSMPPRPSRRTPIRSSVPAAMRSGPATTIPRRSAAASPFRPGSAPTFRNAWT